MNPSNPYGKEEKTYSSTRPQKLYSSILTSLSEFPLKSNGRLKLKAVMPNIPRFSFTVWLLKYFPRTKGEDMTRLILQERYRDPIEG